MTEPLDRKQLYLLGKKVLIWGVFFAVLYILSDLFALMFFTFILAFITSRLSEYAVEHLGITRRFALTGIYLVLVLAIFGLGYLLVPRVFQEARQFAKDLPQAEVKISNALQHFRERYTEFGPIVNTYADPQRMDEGLRRLTDTAVKNLPRFIEGFLSGLMTVVLSIVISFLIVMDLARLRRDVNRLRDTRLHDFFQETAKPIVTFARIVGRAFEAQMFIALINTVLTVIGLIILGMPRVALLGIVVFLLSFVPVLGVLISSIPILLVAFNASGAGLAVLAFCMVLMVHALEAYVVNPRVYAHHMKMNPVLVLIVLVLGHHLFGVWGVLLAVPVTHYFITHVAGLKPAPLRRRGWRGRLQSGEGTDSGEETGDDPSDDADERDESSSREDRLTPASAGPGPSAPTQPEDESPRDTREPTTRSGPI